MKNLIFSLSILFLLLMSSETACAQDFHTTQNTTKKALKAFEKGEAYFQQSDFSAGLEQFQKAVAHDSLFIDAWLLMGDAAAELDSSFIAVQAYENAIQLDTMYFLPTAYLLAKVYLDLMDYDKLIQVLDAVYVQTELPENLLQKIEKLKDDAAFRKYAYANPVAFDPKPLGNAINSPADEYVNALRLDGGLLVFTQRTTQEGKQPFKEQLKLAERDSLTWNQGMVFAPDWPVNEQIGAVTFAADGNSMYFAACGWRDGLGSCDIYFARNIAGAWQLPVNLGSAINSRFWESQPSLSADGKTLVFASNRPGGLGGSDLWQSKLDLNGAWTAPQNFGALINTEANEMAPFLHPDGKTLYFSSAGHAGMGGADLFVSRMDSTGNWQTPVNLGYPINTLSDEINLIVEAAGKTALLSVLNDSLKTYDILTFELPEEHQPRAVTYIQMYVKALDTEKPLIAQIVLSNPVSAEKIIETETNTAGEAFVGIPARDSYALQVNSKGYLFYDSFIHPEAGTDLQPAEIDVFLEAIEVGKKVLLDNILFETNKAVLLPEAKAGLRYLEQFLKQNPALKIRLEGHTDNTGNPIANQKLSLDRAGAVAAFLAEQGIDSKRLEVQGFGAQQPVSGNETPDGRSKNRRVEMHIIADK